MNPKSKIFCQLNKFHFQVKKKWEVFQNIVVTSIFFLFLGFIFGNLFGTFLDFFRSFLNWDGFIIIITICLIECINFLNYKKKEKSKLLEIGQKQGFKSTKNFWKNNLKKIHLFDYNIKKLNLSKKQMPLQKNFQPLQHFSILEKNLNKVANLFSRSKTSLWKSKNQKKMSFLKILHFYKIGLLLGFFIDAFKVGS